MTADSQPGSCQGEVAAFYTHHPFPHERDAWHRYAALYFKQLGLDPSDVAGRRALDAGCGSGAGSEFLVRAGARVVSLDVAPRNLRRMAAARMDVSLQSVLRLGIRSGSVELVHCVGVLHHTPDPREGLRECCRVLRTGGLLVLGIYNRSNIVYPLFYRFARLIPKPLLWPVWRLLSRTLTPRWTGTVPSDDYLRNLFMDQVYTPIAHFFTPREVLGWLQQEGVRVRRIAGLSYFPFFPDAMRAHLVLLGEKEPPR